MTKWDAFFYEKMKKLSKEKLVIDIGGGQPLQKLLPKVKNLFSKTTYISVDYELAFKPTIIGDAHCLPLRSNATSAVICKAVLEHVRNPFIVTKELFRITKRGGKLLVYVPFLHPYYGDKFYQDYFRYTHDGLRELFKDWKHLELQPVRLYLETVSNLLPSPLKNIARPITRFLDHLKPNVPQVSGYYLYVRK